MEFHSLPMPLLLAVAAVYGILLIASVTVRLLITRYPEQDFGELKLRVNSWWIMVFVFTLAVLLNRTLTLVFLGIVSFLALKEYLSMIPTRRADRRVLFYAYLSIPIQYFWIGINWYGMFIIFIPVYVFLFLPLRMLLVGQTEKFLSAAGTLHWGLMVTVFGISHAAYLVVVPEGGDMQANGPSLLFYLVFLTEFNDVAQYIWGKLLGRHPVVPTVSPKKTWEGLLGGVATTLVLAVIMAPYLTPMSVGMAVIAGMIIGFGGFAGDVIISAVKRDIGVKDSGALIPGHGGILDRIDSLSFTAPLFFHFIRYYYLLP
jgi:phosphatidate cytidylyltransferase